MESDLRPIDRDVAVLSLFGLRPWSLDVFVYTPAEVARQRGRIGNLLSYVDAEGRVVYERPKVIDDRGNELLIVKPLP